MDKRGGISIDDWMDVIKQGILIVAFLLMSMAYVNGIEDNTHFEAEAIAQDVALVLAALDASPYSTFATYTGFEGIKLRKFTVVLTGNEVSVNGRKAQVLKHPDTVLSGVEGDTHEWNFRKVGNVIEVARELGPARLQQRCIVPQEKTKFQFVGGPNDDVQANQAQNLLLGGVGAPEGESEELQVTVKRSESEDWPQGTVLVTGGNTEQSMAAACFGFNSLTTLGRRRTGAVYPSVEPGIVVHFINTEGALKDDVRFFAQGLEEYNE